MARVKDWMMVMEEAVVNAIEDGVNTPNGIYAHVQANLPVVDESFVKKYTEELLEELGPHYSRD